MDKDMERLGKERLKRVRRRRQLATFIISMAVIVLGITAYRLIQPASAEDQNKYEFEVDGQKETYTNLGKLKNPPVVKLEGDQPEVEWDGKTFNYKVDMSFAIGEGELKDESGNIIKNYYMTYGQDISIPDAVCDGWHSYTDESGNKFCNYRFIKNNDGTFSVLIKFADDYIQSNTTEIKGGATFGASGYSEVKDKGEEEEKKGGNSDNHCENHIGAGCKNDGKAERDVCDDRSAAAFDGRRGGEPESSGGVFPLSDGNGAGSVRIRSCGRPWQPRHHAGCARAGDGGAA